jgi:quinol monooxygenase YgiN
MIRSTVRLAISAQHRPEVLRILRVLMGHATAKLGCAGFWLSQDLTNPEALTISDQWVTRADLDEHVRSAEYRLLLAVIDLSLTPPEISFDDLGHLGGLDVVQALRAPQHTVWKDDRT